MKLRPLAASILLAALSPLTMAADGTLGTTSTGSSVLQMSLPDNVQVLVEKDVTFTYVQGTASYTDSIGICVYHRGVATAAVTLSTGSVDAGNPTAFNMLNGTNYLPYAVDIDSGSALNTGAKTTGVSAHTTATDCGGAGTYNHQIDVSVTGADADSVPAGNYSDTLTILVEPT